MAEPTIAVAALSSSYTDIDSRSVVDVAAPILKLSSSWAVSAVLATVIPDTNNAAVGAKPKPLSTIVVVVSVWVSRSPTIAEIPAMAT